MKPPGLTSLPERLRAIGFVSGEEIAWRQEDCAEAIDWLRRNQYAVLGIELWLIENGSMWTAIPTESGPAIYVTSCDPIKGEKWEDYVERSAREAAAAISAFHWATDAVGPPRPVHFNLCWADREWFRTKSRHEAYFADE
jgi:hypothetical protein